MCPPKDIIDHTMTQIVIFRDNTIWKKENLTQNPLNYILGPCTQVIATVFCCSGDRLTIGGRKPHVQSHSMEQGINQGHQSHGCSSCSLSFLPEDLVLSHRSQARNAFGRKLARLVCAWQGVILEAFPGRVPPVAHGSREGCPLAPACPRLEMNSPWERVNQGT